MKVITLALAAAAGIAASLAVPATAQAGVAPAFETPSGNILCWVAENAASCHIVDYTYTVQPAPQDCGARPYPSYFRLYEGKAPYIGCGETPPGTYNGVHTDRILGYGETHAVGAMTCTSEVSGVTCTDTSSGRFFRVSRESYQLG